jgi:hypothetical protein
VAAAPDADPIIWEGKVEGQMRQVRRSEADRLMSKAAFADNATRQARELAKIAQQAKAELEQREASRKDAAKKDTDAWLREHGIDPDEYARTKLERKVAEGKMTPEQREAAALKAENAALKAAQDKLAHEREEESRTQATTVLQKRIENELFAAAKRGGLEPGGESFYAVYESFRDMLELGLLPQDGSGLPPHLADRIIDDANERLNGAQSKLEKAVLGGLTGEALLNRLGPAVEKAVLDAALERIRSRKPGYVKPNGQAPAVQAAPPPKPGGYKRPTEFDEAIKKIAGGR